MSMSSRLRASRKRTITTRSADETLKLGVSLAGILPVPGVVLLRGSLGSGKTTLTRGIAEGLGLRDRSLVCSPSFTLVNQYEARCPIYHVDLFRLSGQRDVYSIGLEEFLGRDGITIVEWSERLPFPYASAVEIDIKDAGDDARVISISYPRSMRAGRTVRGAAQGARTRTTTRRRSGKQDS